MEIQQRKKPIKVIIRDIKIHTNPKICIHQQSPGSSLPLNYVIAPKTISNYQAVSKKSETFLTKKANYQKKKK